MRERISKPTETANGKKDRTAEQSAMRSFVSSPVQAPQYPEPQRGAAQPASHEEYERWDGMS